MASGAYAGDQARAKLDRPRVRPRAVPEPVPSSEIKGNKDLT